MKLKNLPYLPTTAETKTTWAHHYKGIIRANTVIEKGKELFGNDEAVQKYIAEAEVLRALFYFNLVRAYGGVPIIMDIPQEYTDSRGHLRASTEEVYIRILTDLTTAIESNNLYRSTNNGEKTPTGRVNKYAAEALLGKSTSIHAERHHRSCLSQRRSMERYICQSKHYRILSGNDHYAIRSRQVLSRRCDKQWRIRIVPEFQ
ncbi:RagB/SusD family nutrient uptake outer membrane protein [Bacteroides xylanisolvens]|nr:RagB/SusD family nutrient uptake outer membrane protein [Bacteroides xylanisolvens]